MTQIGISSIDGVNQQQEESNSEWMKRDAGTDVNLSSLAG